MSNDAKTTVTEVEVGTLAALLGSATGENVISQTPENNIFSNTKSVNTKFSELQNGAKDKEAADAKAKADADAKTKADADAKAKEEEGKKKEKKDDLSETVKTEGKGVEASLAATLSKTQEEQENAVDPEEDKNKGGRPTAYISAINKLIKDKKLIPFDDEKKQEDYTSDDWEALISQNFEHRDEQMREEVSTAFFDSLPEELQIAYTYLAQGGKDVKHILRVVTQAVEVGSLDPETEDGQESIIRNYLKATNYGDPAEIDEEIASLKDQGSLEKKAKQFKPKLDAMQQSIIEQNLKAQEKAQKAAQKQAAQYMDTVYKTLEPATIAGIKLDKKTQGSLYNGLVRPDYQSYTGQMTNELGHLLEVRQFGAEKDRDLESVALALWALRDKQGLLAKIRESGASEKAAEVAKKLKIEQESRGTAANQEDELAGNRREAQKKLQRKTNNIFK